MAKGATLALKITGDASGARAAFGDAEGAVDGFGSKLGGIAKLAAGAFAVGAVVDFGKSAFSAASDLEQMQGSLDAVFGAVSESRVQMTKWSVAAQDSVGLSERAYAQVASVIGSQLKNAGVPMDQLAGKTNALIQQGADMSAVFGGTAADAVDALSSVLKGEFDPIEKYGVSLNQSTINAELAARGQDKLTGAALKQATTQAALDIVTKQTAQTQGQFAAQSGTAAEKAQTLGAWFDNLQASIGSYLLPIFVQLVDFIRGTVGPVFDKLTSDSGPLGPIFDSVGNAIGTLIPIVTGLITELGPKLGPIIGEIGGIIQNFLVPAFNTIVSFVRDYAIPIFKSVLGPVLDGVGKYFHIVSDAIMRNKDTFIGLYDKVKPFLEFLKNDVAPFLGNVLGKAFEVLGTIMGKVIDAIAWILDKAGDVIGFIGDVGSFLFGGGGGGGGQAKPKGAGQLLGATATGSARLFGATSSLGGGAGPSLAGGSLVQAGDTYTITVTGALDPVAVADQIARMLDQRARRIGARPAFGGAA